MLVPRFSLQNLIRLGREVSRLAYQSPPPLYLSNPILNEGEEAVNEESIKTPTIKATRDRNRILTIEQRYCVACNNPCSFCTKTACAKTNNLEIILNCRCNFIRCKITFRTY